MSKKGCSNCRRIRRHKSYTVSITKYIETENRFYTDEHCSLCKRLTITFKQRIKNKKLIRKYLEVLNECQRIS